MRIGIFTETYEPYVSGVVTSIKVLKEALENMHHDVFIVTANLENRKFLYDKKNRIIYIPGIKTGISNTRLTGFYSKKAMKIIKSWNLDIIHSQTEFGVGAFSRIVAKKLKLPVVHTYHTIYEDYVYYVTHGLFDNLGKKLAIKLTKYYCEKKCDELIVPTNKIKELFENKYHIKKEAHVIPTGIDLRKFTLNKDEKDKVLKLKKKYKIKDDDFIVGSISRLAKEKSIDRLIVAMKTLSTYNSKIKLVIVGDGPDATHLKSLVKKLKLEKNIIFTGLIEYEKVGLYYKLFNVLATFSKTETQGLTIIEALAASIPVLGINDESFKEMILDKYNGYLFKDEEDFIKKVEYLADNQQEYKIMCLNAFNSAYKYSKEVFAADVAKVYANAIMKYKDKE